MAENLRISFKKSDAWKVLTVVFAVLFVLSFSGIALSPTGAAVSVMNKETAAANAIKYINANMLAPGYAATLKNIDEKSGLYHIKFDIGGQEYDSYITKDGKVLFPQSVDMTTTTTTTQPPVIPKSDKPGVKLFTMSFCPYGNDAETAMAPVAALLNASVEIEPHYVIYSDFGASNCLDAEQKYCSLHGLQELNQDVRELCVYKYDKAKFWDFIGQVNAKCTSQNADTCWETIATSLGIDADKVKTCQADEAAQLLDAEIALNTQYGVSGSPTLVINDVEYSGARTSEGYKQGVCSAFNTAPTACSKALSSQGGTASGSC